MSYSKNCICKFMQVNLWHHKLFHFHLSFWIWKLWKRREKITKKWISRERKELFRWNKNTFHSFWTAIIWWKNKNLTQALKTSWLIAWIYKSRVISLKAQTLHWDICFNLSNCKQKRIHLFWIVSILCLIWIPGKIYIIRLYYCRINKLFYDEETSTFC